MLEERLEMLAHELVQDRLRRRAGRHLRACLAVAHWVVTADRVRRRAQRAREGRWDGGASKTWWRSMATDAAAELAFQVLEHV